MEDGTTTNTENERTEEGAYLLETTSRMDAVVVNSEDEPNENSNENNSNQWSKFSNVGSSLIALFRLDTEGDHHGRTLLFVVYGWALLFFWFVDLLRPSTFFGVGLFFILVSLLWWFWRPSFGVVINFYVIFIIERILDDVVGKLIVGTGGLICWLYWLKRKGLRNLATSFCGTCLLFILVSNVPEWNGQILAGVLVGSPIYGVYWLAHQALRTWQGLLRDQEGSPSLLFWERIDKCLVCFVRFCAGLIGLAYVSTILFAEMDFDEIVMITFGYGSLLYFVVTMFMVRDRPIRPHSEFLRNNRSTEQAIRRARQLVLNPNDPMAEPLLLV